MYGNSRLSREWPALLLVGATTGALAWITWARIPLILWDQGYALQVAQRIAGGESLYGDVQWCYGPLPVLLAAIVAPHAVVPVAAYSILLVALLASAALLSYSLYRRQFAPAGAGLAAASAVAGLGVWQGYLNSYTPALPLGALAALLVLSGATLALEGRRRAVAALAVGVGLALGLLTKPEYAFACTLLALLSAGLPARSRRGTGALKRPGLAGIVLGVLLAGGVYASLAARAGWHAVLAGVSGYHLLAANGPAFMLRYRGPTTWVQQIASILLLAAILLGVQAYRKWGRAPGYLLASSFGLAQFGLLAGWSSNWLQAAVRRPAQIGDFSLLTRWIGAMTPAQWFVLLRDEAGRTVAIGLLVVCAALLPRWARRLWRGERMTAGQWSLLFWLAYSLLIDLRTYAVGTGFFRGIGFIGVLAGLGAEFPSWDLSRLFRTRARALAVYGFALFVIVGGILSAQWEFGRLDATIEGVPGEVRIGPSMQSFISEAVSYVQERTQPGDYIAAFGPYPGLYYLSGRRNALRQDYLYPGLGDGEDDGRDTLERLERLSPELVLVPQWGSNPGFLQLSAAELGSSGGPVTEEFRSYGRVGPEIEAYVRSHYRLVGPLGDPAFIEFAVFQRIRS